MRTINAARSEIEARTGISWEDAFKYKNSKQITRVAKSYILENPLDYTTFHLVKSLPFIASTGLTVIDGMNKGLKIYDGNIPRIIINAEKMVWVLIFIAACFSLKNKRTLLFFTLILYFWLLTGPVAYSRYRIPAEPFLLLLGFGAIHRKL